MPPAACWEKRGFLLVFTFRPPGTKFSVAELSTFVKVKWRRGGRRASAGGRASERARFWQLNSHKRHPSNGYCRSKARYIKYITEIGHLRSRLSAH